MEQFKLVPSRRRSMGRVSNFQSNSSGLLTTFGGSQEIFCCGLAAAGCQTAAKENARRLAWFCVGVWQPAAKENARRLAWFCVGVWQPAAKENARRLAWFCVGVWQPAAKENARR